MTKQEILERVRAMAAGFKRLAVESAATEHFVRATEQQTTVVNLMRLLHDATGKEHAWNGSEFVPVPEEKP